MSKLGKTKRQTARGTSNGEGEERRAEPTSDVLAQEISNALELDLPPQLVARLGRLLESKVELVVQETQTRFSGPLPHPDVLAEYNRNSPGLAERIVKMAEKQAEHRQSLESVVVRGNTWMGKAGVVFGGVIGILGLCVIALAIYKDAPLEYLGGILVALTALAGLFVWARRKKIRDAEQLQEGMRAIFRGEVAPRHDEKSADDSATAQR